MRKSILSELLFMTGFLALIFYSCKDDSYLTEIPPVPDQSFVEEFDTASAALARGWQFINASDPGGSGVWQDGGGIPPIFHSYSNNGSNAGFIGTDTTSISGDFGTISNWLISPPVIMQNGDRIIFYTRAYLLFDGISDSTDRGNSLQVRINPLGDDVNVGHGPDAGSFTREIFAINSTLIPGSIITPKAFAYPSGWTRFEVTVSGLPHPVKGRFAFRYFVTGGVSARSGTAIGIDSVVYKSVNNE